MIEQSPMFNTIKSYYERKLWTKQMVYNVVAKNAITAAEYKQITSEVYE